MAHPWGDQLPAHVRAADLDLTRDAWRTWLRRSLRALVFLLSGIGSAALVVVAFIEAGPADSRNGGWLFVMIVAAFFASVSPIWAWKYDIAALASAPRVRRLLRQNPWRPFRGVLLRRYLEIPNRGGVERHTHWFLEAGLPGGEFLTKVRRSGPDPGLEAVLAGSATLWTCGPVDEAPVVLTTTGAMLSPTRRFVDDRLGERAIRDKRWQGTVEVTRSPVLGD